MGHALEATVHKAGIPQIRKPHSSSFAVGSYNHFNFLVQLLFFSESTVPKMVAFVFFLTGLRAVSNLLTATRKWEFLVFIAPFAFRFVRRLEEPVAVVINAFNNKVVSFFKLKARKSVGLVLEFFPDPVDSVGSGQRCTFFLNVFVKQLHGHIFSILPEPDSAISV